MRTICLYFQVHQPMRLKRYRFFDIGSDHYYYDDYMNESIIRKVADKCYMPANKVIKKIISEYGCKFKITFSITGIALDQMKLYAPDVLESFQELAKTGCVEFLAETYAHSLSAFKDRDEFATQVQDHSDLIKELFGQEPKVFRNTELIYSDEIGAMLADLGYSAMLTEGASHILGWKSPNFLYYNATNPKMKVLLKNFKLSDDIAFRFSNRGWSEFPLTAEKYAGWLKAIDKKEETVNLFMDYETFGEHQWMETGIFEFLSNLPKQVFKKTDFVFSTPTEIVKNLQPVAAVKVPYPISWADAERDLTAWLGNDLQEDAFNALYDISKQIKLCHHPKILKDWYYLQASDHFYYMCTKFFSDGEVHAYFNPYDTPYDAYINYMNILSDFKLRLHADVPETDKDNEIASLTSIIKEKEKIISQYEENIRRLKTPAAKTKPAKTVAVKKKQPAKKAVKSTAVKSGIKKPSTTKHKITNKSTTKKTTK